MNEFKSLGAEFTSRSIINVNYIKVITFASADGRIGSASLNHTSCCLHSLSSWISPCCQCVILIQDNTSPQEDCSYHHKNCDWSPFQGNHLLVPRQIKVLFLMLCFCCTKLPQATAFILTSRRCELQIVACAWVMVADVPTSVPAIYTNSSNLYTNYILHLPHKRKQTWGFHLMFDSSSVC